MAPGAGADHTGAGVEKRAGEEERVRDGSVHSFLGDCYHLVAICYLCPTLAKRELIEGGQDANAVPTLMPSLPSVCREVSILCDHLATHHGQVVDLSFPVFMAILNVICVICFNISYKIGDPELKTIRNFSRNILESLGNETLVDIFPWLQVRMKPNDTFRSQQTQPVSLILLLL